MRARRFLPACAVAITLGIPLPATAGPKCFPREGHCIVVEVNGQPSLKLTGKTKKLLRDIEKASESAIVSHDVKETRYELAAPIRGTFAVKATMVKGSDSWFGTATPDADVMVLPLQRVQLDTNRELARDETVRLGGAAAVTEANVLKENRLPPGNYLMFVALRGPKNWDRQTLFFRVEKD